MLGCWVVCGFEVCEVDVFLGVILRDIGYIAFLLDLRLVYRWNYLFKLEVLGNLDLYLLLWLHLRLFRRHTLCLICYQLKQDYWGSAKPQLAMLPKPALKLLAT